MSDLTKIAATETPARRRSKLEPYLTDLRRLQEEGYSLEQLRAFLEKIDVSVSRQTIYEFLKRRESVVSNSLPPLVPSSEANTASETTQKANAEPKKIVKKQDVKQATQDQLKAITRGNINPNDFIDEE